MQTTEIIALVAITVLAVIAAISLRMIAKNEKRIRYIEEMLREWND